MQKNNSCGVLLVNTGTPEAPTPHAVRKYLAEFLMDPRIMPMNRVAWWLILHLFILPMRGRASAKKYATIWTDEGSPFAIFHEKIKQGLQEALANEANPVEVRHAMSYGSPKISDALNALKEAGCSHLVVLPLYPQSAYSTTGSVSDSLERAFRHQNLHLPSTFIDNYHDNSAYIKAIAASILQAGFNLTSDDRLLFSFHSTPLKDIEAGDTYELQVRTSCSLIANELGLESSRWTIGFQSRFDKGRQWLTPFTKDILNRWAQEGQGRVFLVCPNFVVDCLETLYDVDNELLPHYQAAMQAAGRMPNGDDFVYVPCLNSSLSHVQVLAKVLHPYLDEDHMTTD